MNEEQLINLLADVENYGLEFKAASNSYSDGKLHDYAAALSNEDGGYFILGVNDARKIIGTNSFSGNWNRLPHILSQNLGIRIKVYEVKTAKGRVLVFEIPRHITSTPVLVKGGTGKYKYPIRDGESLVEMSTETLQNIFAERENDWSASTAKGVAISDLDEHSLEAYRIAWAKKVNDTSRLATSFYSMLNDLRLMSDDEVTNAAVLLFGREKVLSQMVPDAEIIFEWRNSSKDIAYGERKNWRAGFITIKDEVWNTINARNTNFRYQEGFIQREIKAYDEESIREAVVNAFVHRDYTITGRSIVIRTSPDLFYIENPGRLMPGVTVENILDKSAWRNRLLAESLEKVNLMERSSQGMDTIYRHTIESGKGFPTLKVTSDPSIELSIPATLVDQSFVSYLEQVANKNQVTLSLKEMIELEYIRKGNKSNKLEYKDRFLSLGIIEKVGTGRSSRYILSHQYYAYANDPGVHTRIVGLPRAVKRNIILEHLKVHKKVTSRELQSAMPDMEPKEISTMLKGMRKDGLIKYHGPSPRWGYWTADGEGNTDSTVNSNES